MICISSSYIIIWLEFKANVEEIELINWWSHTKPKSLCWIKHVFKLRVNRKLLIKNVFLKYRLSMLLSQLWTLSDHCVATTNKLFSSTTVFTYLTYDFYSCRLKPDWWIWGFWGGKFLDLLLKQPVIAIILQLSFHLPLKRDIFLTNQFLRVFWSFVLGLWFNRLEEHLLLLRVNNSNNQSSFLKIGYFWLYCLLQHWSLHSLLSL